MILSKNLYIKLVIISISEILDPCFTLISNRHLYDISLIIAAKVFIKSVFSFCLKP